jgi:hypothetical protein
MTVDNWIALGAILATLAAPVIMVLLEYKLNNKNKGEKETQPLIVRRPRTATTRTLGLLLFAVPTATLSYELFSAAPVTRLTILIISLSIASILFMLVMGYIGRIIGILEDFTTLHREHVGINREVLGILGRRNKKKRRLTQPSTGRAKAARR